MGTPRQKWGINDSPDGGAINSLYEARLGFPASVAGTQMAVLESLTMGGLYDNRITARNDGAFGDSVGDAHDGLSLYDKSGGRRTKRSRRESVKQ